MDITVLRKALRGYVEETMDTKSYTILSFGARHAKTQWKMVNDELWIPDKDFVLQDKEWFTFMDGIEIQEVGREFHARLMRAHDWRGVTYWVTHDGEYHGVTRFNFNHDGHTWAGTTIPQPQDKGAYYWTGSSERSRNGDGGNNALAARFLPAGQVDIVSRDKTEGMHLRLIIDQNWTSATA